MKPRNLRLTALIALLALIAVGCGGGDTSDETTTTGAAAATTAAPSATTAPPAATTTAPDGGATTTIGSSDAIELEISAVDSEGFSTSRLEVVAGAEVILTFVNKDGGDEAHNVHVRTDTDDWFTELKQGPDTQSITFTIGTPGEYQFFCDTHSETMKGTLVVTAP